MVNRKRSRSKLVSTEELCRRIAEGMKNPEYVKALKEFIRKTTS